MTAHAAPARFKLVRLELAREAAHPEGDPGQGYRLVLPLTPEGLIDAEAWRAEPDRCRVVREDAEGELVGRLEHGPGGRWAFRYPGEGEHRDLGFRLGQERFVTGEYVSVHRDDGDHTYRVVSQQPA
jgi:hypothetical protein